jgi:hypothetical protein
VTNLGLAWVEEQLEMLVHQGRIYPGLYLDILKELKRDPTAYWLTVWQKVMKEVCEG